MKQVRVATVVKVVSEPVVMIMRPVEVGAGAGLRSWQLRRLVV